VNGEVETQRRKKIRDGDVIQLGGETLQVTLASWSKFCAVGVRDAFLKRKEYWASPVCDARPRLHYACHIFPF
jgi:hypothetical protein